MKTDTSKYALSSKQAAKNSAKSPWRRQAFCQTRRALESRAELDRREREEAARGE